MRPTSGGACDVPAPLNTDSAKSVDEGGGREEWGGELVTKGPDFIA